MKEKKEIVLAKESIFQYRRVISYFMTIFFTFFLMMILLLVIALSREVLSDREFEEYVLQTKSLLNELEKVEEDKFQAYENYSINLSNYDSKTIFTRLNVDDFSRLSPENRTHTYLTLKINYTIRVFNDDLLVILDMEPEIGDDVLVIISQEESRAKVIDILEDGSLIVLNPYPQSELGKFAEISPRNYRGVFLE